MRYDPSKISPAERERLVIAIGDVPVQGAAQGSRHFPTAPRRKGPTSHPNPRREHVPRRR